MRCARCGTPIISADGRCETCAEVSSRVARRIGQPQGLPPTLVQLRRESVQETRCLGDGVAVVRTLAGDAVYIEESVARDVLQRIEEARRPRVTHGAFLRGGRS